MILKTLKFYKEPEYADLWDAFVYNFLYDKKKYVSEILSLFKKIGINKNSKILDSSAGTGFISLDLRKLGYNVECMDLMEDEIRVFKRKAKKLGVSSQIKKIAWKDIPKIYKNKKFDFIFCRGNSFIYADGGWNKKQKVNIKSSLKSYENTLDIFYNQLNERGHLYVDKFPDNEKPVNEPICFIKVGNKPLEKFVAYIKWFPKERYREAYAIRESEGQIIAKTPNITMDLRGEEIEYLMKKVGFKPKKLNLKTENHFVVWLAKKE